jgi:hypothetical protein
MKFGDRTQFGSTVLASSLVVDLQLIAAVLYWWSSTNGVDGTISANAMASITSLAGGALIANMLSVVLLIIETSQVRR